MWQKRQYLVLLGARDGAVDLGSAPQDGSSWFRFPMVSLALNFRPRYGPGLDSNSNRNEHKEYFLGVKEGRCVGLTILLLACAVFKCGRLDLSEPSGLLQACTGIALLVLFRIYSHICGHMITLDIKSSAWLGIHWQLSCSNQISLVTSRLKS
jgi:hypothetical protein